MPNPTCITTWHCWYTKKKKKEPGSIGSITDIMAGLNQAAAIATKTVHELAHMAAAKAERGE